MSGNLMFCPRCSTNLTFLLARLYCFAMVVHLDDFNRLVFIDCGKLYQLTYAKLHFHPYHSPRPDDH